MLSKISAYSRGVHNKLATRAFSSSKEPKRVVVTGGAG